MGVVDSGELGTKTGRTELEGFVRWCGLESPLFRGPPISRKA